MVEAREVYDFIKLYRELVEKAKKEQINPLQIDINDLKELVSDDILTNGLVISLLAKIVKLKAEYLEKQITPEESKQQTIKSIFKEVLKEETKLEEEDIESLLMVESIREKLRKPKTVKPKRISYQEFKQITKEQIKEALFENTDYNSYALQIVKQIEKGTFKIRSFKDFIGLMFAIYIFNLQIDDIKEFLK